MAEKYFAAEEAAPPPARLLKRAGAGDIAPIDEPKIISSLTKLKGIASMIATPDTSIVHRSGGGNPLTTWIALAWLTCFAAFLTLAENAPDIDFD